MTRLKAVLLVAALSLFLAVSAGAQNFPTGPITYMNPFNPGGEVDIAARAMQPYLEKYFAQPFVINYQPGAGGALCWSKLAAAKPDGYTIGGFSIPHIILQPIFMKDVAYKTDDFVILSIVEYTPIGLAVKKDHPVNTFKEFIDYAKANPGKIRYATAGAGTPQHLVMERLAIEEKIKWTLVPFDGGGPAVSALMGGHVEAISQTTEWKKHVESGRLRLLAVYGEKRMDDFPNAPTLLELGYKITAPSLISIIGPKGLSPQVVDTLHGAFKKAMDDPDFIKVSNQMDQPLLYRGPQDLAKHLVQMNNEVGTLIRNLGLRKE